MKATMILPFFLSLFVCISFADNPAKEAEEDTIPVFRMGEIVVVAERLPMISMTTIQEIDADHLRSRDIRQPAEALQFLPGLHVYTAAKNEAVFNLRGFGQRQISVFLDGVPVSLPYDGQIDLSQFGGDHIDRIRVSTGTTSPLYGINTLGGSVNLISGMTDRTHAFSLRLEGGSHGRYFGHADYQHRFGALRVALHTSLSDNDNFRLPADFNKTDNENGGRRNNSASRNWSGGVKLLYDFSPRHQTGFNISRIDNEYYIPPNSRTQFVRYWRFPEWQKTVYSISSRHLFSSSFIVRTVLFHDTYNNLLKSFDDDSYTTQNMRYAWNSKHDDHSTGFFIYPSLKLWERGSTNAILAYKRDVHREKFRDFPFETYEMATFNAGIEQDIQLSEKHAFVLGGDLSYLEPIKAEGAELRDPILLTNGQIAWQYGMGRELNLHTSLGKKSRFPTLKELYSERLGRTIPNHDLKAEHAFNTELGIQKKYKSASLRGVVFYNTLHDLIMLRQLGEGNEQLQNTGRAIVRGFELDATFGFRSVSFFANYTMLDAINISSGRPNRHLPNRPYHRFNLVADWTILPALGSVLEASYVADQYYEHTDNLTWHKFDDYILLNAKISYRLRNDLKWYLRINNLTDTVYENDFGVPMPGRELLTGIRFTL
jgi:iron complex outermembrane receptor protein